MLFGLLTDYSNYNFLQLFINLTDLIYLDLSNNQLGRLYVFLIYSVVKKKESMIIWIMKIIIQLHYIIDEKNTAQVQVIRNHTIHS